MKACSLLALLVSGCAASAPAPIVYGEPPPAAFARETAPAPARDFSNAEALSDFALRPEDIAPFHPASAPRTHRIEGAETLADIAVRYQIPVAALIAENDLIPPYALRRGQDIRLPAPRRHRVAQGETFASIADRYAMDPRSLALFNRMTPPYAVREGDLIALPAIPGAPSAPTSTPPPTAEEHHIAALGQPGGRFTWPVSGQVLARFGAQAGGAHLDGIEIAAQDGAPIRAAGDGEVVYAGADLPAYGVLVLVRHEGDYVTAYAYARGAQVREGQRVRAGDVLASVDAGARDPARMLFQVRQGREAIDPLTVLRAR